MDIPLVIAIVALLAFALLPVLDPLRRIGDQRQRATCLLDPYRTLDQRYPGSNPWEKLSAYPNKGSPLVGVVAGIRPDATIRDIRIGF